MNCLKKLWLSVLALSILISCADESKLLFEVNKPESLAELEFLNDYDVLKAYIDRGANPGFKLGAGVSVGDFTRQGVEYSMIVSNFDEVVAGWEMKHGGVVQDDGSLSLANVASFIAKAKAADIAIYGHTLCWHANQNAQYLNSTIAPTVIPGSGGPPLEPSVITNSDFESGDGGWSGWGNGSTRGVTANGEGYGGAGYAYWFTNPSATNFWEAQVAFDFASALQENSTYKLTFKVKASTAGNIRAEIQSPAHGYASDGFGTFPITTDWEEVTLETKALADHRTRFLFSFGDYAGTVYVDDVLLQRVNPEGGGGPTLEPNVITNSDFENGDGGWGGWGNGSTRGVTANGQGYGGTGYAYWFTNPSATNFWEAQVAFDFASALQENSTYKLTFKVKASTAGNIRAEIQSPAHGYASDGFGTFPITTDWEEVTLETKALADHRTRFLFSFGDYAGTVYVDDVMLQRINPDGGGAQIIEKTPAEKKEIIYGELERWIAGIMEVSKENTKAWDVVNEPMDDGNPFELKSGVGRTLAADEFYWQDYLGKDYAVDAFKLAAQYGNSDDKLFINDYNLEYNLDKCRGIIEYVEYIESKGARVDGIGTQMHISTNSDKDKIVDMLNLLAATGKLIKISELDIGVGVQTNAATDEHYKAQADMYKFVVEKYFEIIPANQRYGITVWSPKDSPAGSSWRAGEPIGLWTEGYSRKRAYAGFADGLKLK